MTLGEQLKAKGINVSKGEAFKQNEVEGLFTAIEKGQIKEAINLIESGIPVNSTNNFGETPLIAAAENNNEKLCTYLLNNGADINAVDNDGQTALMKAAAANAKQILEIFISKKANINQRDYYGQTALMLAAENNAEETGNLLLLNGADFELKDSKGKTARDIAISKYARFTRNFFLSDQKLLALKKKEIKTTLMQKKDLNLKKFKVKEFCHNLVNEKFGDKININDAQASLSKQFGSVPEYFKKLLFSIAETQCTNSIYIPKLTNDEIQFLFDEKKFINFCNSILIGKSFGDKIFFEDVNKEFLQKFNCKPSKLEELFYSSAAKNNYLRIEHIELFKTEKYVLLFPDENEIKSFCYSIIYSVNKKDSSNELTFDKIKELWTKKYNCSASNLKYWLISTAEELGKKKDIEGVLNLPPEEKDSCLKKSIYYINNILSKQKIGFEISISEIMEKFKNQYKLKLDIDCIKRSIACIDKNFYELDFSPTIIKDNIVLCPNENAVIKFCNELNTIKSSNELICLKDAEEFLFHEYGISSEIISKEFFNKSQNIIYEIISVEIINGSELRKDWNTPMQKVTTNKGTFIDNIPNRQHGFYKIANPGFDWSTLVGKKTSNVKIFNSRGFYWINYHK